MATWLGEIRCLKCGHWQIPRTYCPNCGHKWELLDYDAMKSSTVLAKSFTPTSDWVPDRGGSLLMTRGRVQLMDGK